MITSLPIEPAPTAAPLDDHLRERLAALADVLIPGNAVMPSATSVDVHHKLIDRAAAARPDLIPALHAVLHSLPDSVAGDDIRIAADAFAAKDPDTFTAFGQLLKGAYFLAPAVSASIGYPGQEARPLVDDVDVYIELLADVVERGEIFRPTPHSEEPRP